MLGKWICSILLIVWSTSFAQGFAPDTTSIDSSEFFVVRKVFFTGNKTTKDKIMLRELTFAQGDTVFAAKMEAELERSRQNLMNTALFNFVKVQRLPVISDMPSDTIWADILIEVTERWYTWPVPILELVDPNFNQWWLTKDFSRLNYGLYMYRQNFRGRNETLAVIARFGYSKQFGINYKIPYLNKAQTLGISITSLFQQSREFPYATINNERQFFNLPDQNVREQLIHKLIFTYKKGLYTSNSLEIRHNYMQVQDSILTLNPEYLSQGNTATNYFNLVYTFVREKRDLKAYPLKGHYLSVKLEKNGLGLLDDGVDAAFVLLNAKKYITINDRFYWAGGFKTKLSAGPDFPYSLQNTLGYDHYVRGYEYYIIDGQNFALVKTNLKFRLFGPKVVTLDFVPTEKFGTFHYAFYLNLFADAGYVDDTRFNEVNPLANEWMFGTGIGIDFVTYYDKVVRLEYSFNRLNESGIFLHFSKSI